MERGGVFPKLLSVGGCCVSLLGEGMASGAAGLGAGFALGKEPGRVPGAAAAAPPSARSLSLPAEPREQNTTVCSLRASANS